MDHLLGNKCLYVVTWIISFFQNYNPKYLKQGMVYRSKYEENKKPWLCWQTQMEKCCLWILSIGGNNVMQWKIHTKEILLKTEWCDGFFRYEKQAWGHWTDHLIYAANVLLSSVLTDSFCLFTAPLPNCQPWIIIQYFSRTHHKLFANAYWWNYIYYLVGRNNMIVF